MAHKTSNANQHQMVSDDLLGDLQELINASLDRDVQESTAPSMSQVFPQSASLPVMPSHMPAVSPALAAAVPAAASTANRKPYIRIVVEPANRISRFRYKCEGRFASSIAGMSLGPEGGKTFPTIEIVGYQGPVVVVVSCVTRDQPYRQHPHWLVSKDEQENCKFGVYRVRLPPEQRRLELQKVGIQCVKRTDVRTSLQQRETMNVDPFNAKFDHKDNVGSINLYELRLCYQAFIPEGNSKEFTKPLDPVVSEPIFGKSNVLTINRLCSCSGKVSGGDEIIMLCEKIAKEDIQIRFFETNDAGVEVWQAFAEFQQTDIYKQTAIAFKTPRYRNPEVTHSVNVELQLLRPSDRATSAPLPFEYFPNPDTSFQQRRLEARRAIDSCKRKILNTDILQQSAKQHKKLSQQNTLTTFPSSSGNSPGYVPEIKAENLIYDMDARSCASASPYNNQQYNYPASPSSCSTADSISPTYQQNQQLMQLLKQQELQQQLEAIKLQQPEQLSYHMNMSNANGNWNTSTLFNGGSITPTNLVPNNNGNGHINYINNVQSSPTTLNNNNNLFNVISPVAPTNFMQTNVAFPTYKQQQPQPQPQPQQFVMPEAHAQLQQLVQPQVQQPQLQAPQVQQQQSQQEPSLSDLITTTTLLDLENIDTNELMQNLHETFGNLDMDRTLLSQQMNNY